jgi:hypothetical protein
LKKRMQHILSSIHTHTAHKSSIGHSTVPASNQTYLQA